MSPINKASKPSSCKFIRQHLEWNGVEMGENKYFTAGEEKKNLQKKGKIHLSA